MSRQNWTIKAKLFAATIAASAIMLALTGVTRFFILRMSAAAEVYSHQIFPESQRLARITSSFKDMRIALNRLALPDATAQDVTKLAERYEGNAKDLSSMVGEIREHRSRDEGTQKLNDALAAAILSYLDIARKIVPLSLDVANVGQRAAYLKSLSAGIRKFATDFEDALGALRDQQSKDAVATTLILDRAEADCLVVSLVVCVAGLLVVLAGGWFFARSISATLEQVATDLKRGAQQLAATSSEVNEASAGLSASTAAQATAVQQTVVAIDEINAMVGRNVQNANRSREDSASSLVVAENGKRAVDDVIGSINEIDRSIGDVVTQSEASNRDIGDIVKVISEIASKTRIINDIAFQTKLLSFNASVEAARAGAHGTGFSVVAQEVGNLAQTSGNAAQEITKLLDASTKTVQGIVAESQSRILTLVSESKNRMAKGKQTAMRCGTVLDELLRFAQELSKMTADIAAASQQQAKGVEEITRAISQVDDATQINATAARDAANISDDLARQAQSVDRSVVRLESMVRRDPSGTSTSVPLAVAPAISIGTERSERERDNGQHVEDAGRGEGIPPRVAG